MPKSKKDLAKGTPRQLTRREFIGITGSAAAGLVLLPLFPGKARASFAEELKDTGLSSGYAVGDVTPTGGLLWLRAESDGSVSVQYGKDPTLRAFTGTKPIIPNREKDFTAKLLLDGLDPGTTYYYRVTVSGKKPGPIARFVTAPRPEDVADVSFAFSGDTRESYKPFTIMDSIQKMKPDFFLHLGDTIYADKEGIASKLPDFWEKYRNNRDDPPTQRLFSEISLYVVWDDHEVSDNFHPANPLAPIGRKAFFDYWPVRQDPKDPDRVYRSFRWGRAVELFILDTRQYRDSVEGTILGKEQKQWFLEALASSTALFKFVGTSVPFSSSNVDKWGGYPADRNEILGLIAKKKIGGVVFLTADVHYAAVSRVPGKLALKEIIVGPLGAQMNRATAGTAKRFEFFSSESFNYGLVKVHVKAGSPFAAIEIRDQNNKVLHKTRFDLPSQAS